MANIAAFIQEKGLKRSLPQIIDDVEDDCNGEQGSMTDKKNQ